MNNFDVIIVGAGLSGIGGATHLMTECPDKTFTILEGREAMGGTWDLFRYPGVRSDSDMYTLGYRLRPWRNPKAIADGPSIREYIRDTAREFGIEKHIRYGHRVQKASWNSEEAKWTIEAAVGQRVETFRCSFIYLCTGYYDYENGYTPDFPGVEDFNGTVIHPQKWPEDLDYSGKRVVVIGSGATAVTLVPAMADDAAHVTMLQRTPTYVISRPSTDIVANFFRKVLPDKLAYMLTRWKNILLWMYFYNFSRNKPEKAKEFIAKGVKSELGDGFDMTHFTPTYNPWEQRLCLVPDSDLFKVVKEGRASVVTDHIERFDEKGIRLKSGKHLDADIVVTATGLVVKIMAGLKLVVDGRDIELPSLVSYKGMMYSGIPNLAQAFGYTNASWTLKCDLTSEYVCRLLEYMDENGYASCTPRLDDPTVERLPALDFNSGYILRALKELPTQGSKHPWRLHQNYIKDLKMLRYGELVDEAMEFAPRSGAVAGSR
jgi:cation diffusion facilitator CzcD-associated flavoprotein CzcO